MKALPSVIKYRYFWFSCKFVTLSLYVKPQFFTQTLEAKGTLYFPVSILWIVVWDDIGVWLRYIKLLSLSVFLRVKWAKIKPCLLERCGTSSSNKSQCTMTCYQKNLCINFNKKVQKKFKFKLQTFVAARTIRLHRTLASSSRQRVAMTVNFKSGKCSPGFKDMRGTLHWSQFFSLFNSCRWTLIDLVLNF